jgi:hypothetical protein
MRKSNRPISIDPTRTPVQRAYLAQVLPGMGVLGVFTRTQTRKQSNLAETGQAASREVLYSKNGPPGLRLELRFFFLAAMGLDKRGGVCCQSDTTDRLEAIHADELSAAIFQIAVVEHSRIADHIATSPARRGGGTLARLVSPAGNLPQFVFSLIGGQYPRMGRSLSVTRITSECSRQAWGKHNLGHSFLALQS